MSENTFVGALSYHIHHPVGKRGAMDRPWMRSYLVEIKAMCKRTEMPNMSLKKPVWMFQITEPSNDSAQSPGSPQRKLAEEPLSLSRSTSKSMKDNKWLLFSAANFG